MLVLQEESDMRGQELQEEVVSITLDTQFCVSSHGYVFNPKPQRSTSRSNRFGRETSDSQISECTRGHFSNFRYRVASFKILKNYVMIIGKMFKSGGMQLSVNNHRKKPNDACCLKFYHQHYIYIIEHILIWTIQLISIVCFFFIIFFDIHVESGAIEFTTAPVDVSRLCRESVYIKNRMRL